MAGRDTQNLGIVLRGVGVSPGIVLGTVRRLDREDVTIEHVHLPQGLLGSELARLEAAIVQAEREIDQLERRLADEERAELEALAASGAHSDLEPAEHHGLLTAHRLMLRDQMLIGETERHIRDERVNAEWALQMTLQHLAEIFDRMDDPFFKERGSDVQHVGELLMRTLTGEAGERYSVFKHVERGAIVVAESLSPAEALALSRRDIAAFVLDEGTPTSHTAIVARSLGIPAVLGVGAASQHSGDGDRIIVDGDEGEIVVRPSEAEELLYGRRARRARAFQKALKQNRHAQATTPDGVTVALRGNLELIEETSRISEFGGEGVGLFRTEFLFLDRTTAPTEQEQFETYVQVIEAMAPHPVTIRTLDIGGDKLLPEGHALGPIASPGLRAVRLSLKEERLFRTQLRALFRASARGNLRLLVPFVTTLSEVLAVKAIMTSVRHELAAAGVPMAPDIPLGFMIEVPAAALIADVIAREADFLSVGTNDLIQYTLAISRDDSSVEHLYQPLHPAVLRLLHMIARAAKAAHIPVGMCGEMAGDPRYALVLVALGFTELSMTPLSIPRVKEIIRRTRRAEAKQLLQKVQRLDDIGQINDLVESTMVSRFPELVTPKMRGAPRFAR